MRKIAKFVPGVLLVAFAGSLAWSQPEPGAESESRVYREGGSWVEQVSGSVPPARSLHIKTTMGNVRVRGGSQGNIIYVVRKRVGKVSEKSARHVLENFRVTSGRHGDTALIDGQAAGSLRYLSADFEINVPRAMDSIKIETMGGDVAVNNVSARVEAETGGGNLQMNDIGASLAASTLGGNVEIGTVAGDVNLRSAGGSITIGSAAGQIEAQTYGGSIDVGDGNGSIQLQTAGGDIGVKKCKGALHAVTAGGSIEVGDVGSTAVLDTAGGSIRLRSAKGRVHAKTMGGGIRLSRLSQGAKAETAAGEIEVEFISEPGAFSESLLETMAGDIVVYLPSRTPLTLRANIDMAEGHNIHSDFKELKVSGDGGDYGSRELFGEGKLNGGGPVLKIHTTAGNIELHRK